MTMIDDQPKSTDLSPLEAFKRQLPDPDPQETSEWIEALDDIVEHVGKERAYFVLRKVLKRARQIDLGLGYSQLDHFRREIVRGQGLSSYPHPRLMPDFWEFPTVSMGLGPLNAIYQARFNRYLHQRGLADTSLSKVWAFVGDGEMDEPEA